MASSDNNPPERRGRVLPVLIGAWAAALGFCPFVRHAPNRLVSGQGIGFLWAADPATIAATAATGAAILVLWLGGRHAARWGVPVLAMLLILLVLEAAGVAAATLDASGGPVARTAPGAGFWLSILCAALIVADSLHRSKASPMAGLLLAAAVALAIAAMAAAGLFDALSIAKEYQQRRAIFAAELERHCLLAGAAVAAALLVGVPLGVALARRPRAQAPAFAALNLAQTIPSLALFGLLIGPLSALAKTIPALAALGIGGVGAAPALIAIILYSLLPIVRNTQAGIAGIDPAIVESAIAMGLTRSQRLWKVELPLAAPIVVAGVRIVTVQAIGLVVVAALVGAGGLGTFVFQGLGQYATDLVLLGVLPTIALALAADLLLRGAVVATAGRAWR